MTQPVNGILLLDKPTGLTSNAALQRVKRLFRAKKAGHTGSLDPVATGLLPVCFGEATGFSQFLLESDKMYEVTAKLGEQTTTGDSEGEIIKRLPVGHIEQTQILNVMKHFVGEIDQVPPMFSAIKFKGRPLYELARRGIEVERHARRIKIFSIQLLALQQDQFSFQLHCSKGTYVRTLVEDIGRDLGCGAHVICLRRTRVSPYDQSGMHTLAALEESAQKHGQAPLACLLPIETSVQTLFALTLPVASAFYLRTGQCVRTTLPNGTEVGMRFKLYSEDEIFLGVGEVTTDGRIKPMRLVKSS